MSADEKELGASPQVPGPIAPVQATPTATHTNWACPIAVGESVKPSQGEWSSYTSNVNGGGIPNYRTIESADYPSSGFSLTGYISEEDAHTLAAAKEMEKALRLFLRQWNACGPNSDFGRYFSNVRAAALASLSSKGI